MKIKKINSIVLIIMALLLFGMSAFNLTLYGSANAGENGDVNGNIIQPFGTDYDYIGKPVSTCINADDLYIADSSNKKIYIYSVKTLEISGQKSTVELSITPTKIRYGSGVIYILDNNQTLWTYSNDELTQNETEILDFDILNNKIAKVQNGTIKFCDLDGGNLSEIAYLGDFSSIAIFGSVPYYIAKEMGSYSLYKVEGGSSTVVGSDLSQTLLAGSAKELILYSGTKYRVYSESLGEEQPFNAEERILDVFQGEIQVRIDESCNAVIVKNKGETKICYISVDETHLYNPIDVTTSNGKIYSLDEKQIKIVENGTVINSIDVSSKKNKRAVSVDSEGNIYLVVNDRVFKYGKNNDESEISNPVYTNFSDITFCVDGSMYILCDQTKILKLSGNSITPFLGEISAQKIACSSKSQLIYLLNGNSITVYDLKTKAILRTVSTGKTGIKDIQVDFNNNIFLIYKAESDFKLLKYTYSDGNYALSYDKIIKNSVINPKGIVAFAINDSTGELLIADKELSYILSTQKSDNGTWISTDIPKVQIPNGYNVKNYSFGNGSTIKIGIVEAYPSTLLYPVHTDFSSNPIYPSGVMNANTVVLENNREIIILDSNNEYYYVIANGSAGFVLKDSVALKAETSFEPYTVAPLQDSVVLYSYPSEKSDVISNSIVSRYPIKKDGGNFLVYKKDSPIIYAVSNVFDFEGGRWLEVSYEGKSAFVLYNSVLKKTQSSDSGIFSYGKISTSIGGGNANIYKDKNCESGIVGSISDNTRVKVFYTVDGFAFVQYENSDGEIIARGYIEEGYLLKNGLTATQLMLVIMILSIVALSIVTIIVVHIFKK